LPTKFEAAERIAAVVGRMAGQRVVSLAVHQANFRAPRRALLQALDVMGDGLNLIISQTGQRFLVRHLSGIVSLAKQ